MESKGEEALRESEYFFRESQRTGNIGSYKTDFSSGHWESSEVLDSILGIDESYDRGVQGWLDLVHPDDQAMMDQYLREVVIAGRKPFSKEYRIVRKRDGSTRWVFGRGEVSFDADGNVLLLFGTIQDITEHKAAEEALQNTTQRLQLATTSARMGVWDWDLRSETMTWDERMLELFGVTREALRGTVQDWKDGLHPDDLHRAIAECDAALAGEAPFDTEFRVRHRDGVILWIKANAAVMRDQHGNPVRMIGLNQDITERKRAERALLESEERFRVAMEATNDGLWDWNVATGEVYFSPAYARMLGYEPAAFPTEVDSWREMLFPEEQEQVLATIQGCIEGACQDFAVEHRIRTRDGGRKWVLGRGQAVSRDEKGHALRMTGTTLDITDRKNAEESLRISEEKFAKIFRLSPDAIDLTRTADGLSMDLNNSYTKLLGFTPEEFLGRSTLPGELGIWVNAEDRDRHMAMLKERGEMLGFEAPLRRKDGSQFIAQISSSALVIDGEQFNITITRDISERKLAEEALRESEDRFNTAFRFLPVGACIATLKEGRFLAVNSQFMEIFGYSEDELLGQTSEAYGMWVNQEDRARIAATAGQGESPKSCEFQIRRKDGSLGWMAYSGQRIISNGTECLLSGIVDISERKKAEAHQRLLEAQLQQAQKMESLGALVAGVAHNINNVLAIIMGTASFREQGALEPADLKAYRAIGRACTRGRDVVRSLVQFAKPIISNQAPFELHMLIQELCGLLENTTSKRIKIIEDFAAGPVWVDGDAGTFNHALMNLAINSVDAMPNGGTLIFRTRLLEEDWAELSVVDDGEGIAQELLSKVMEPFFTTKVDNKGTGLGLSMTYGVIKAHGGTIDLASPPGQGTTARIRIPRVPAPVNIADR